MRVLSNILLLSAVFLCGCGPDVELDSQDWNYQNGECTVRMILKNNSDLHTTRSVRIIVHRQRDIGRGAVVNRIIGEKIITIHLQPLETRSVTEQVVLPFPAKPSRVTITQFNPD